MNKILYISGDGVNSTKQKWKIYFNYFDPFWKNYFITKALKSMVNNCEILNFSHQIWLLKLILKLESLGMYGSTKIRLKVINTFHSFIQNIIYRKINNNDYDLIIFSDNLFFLNSILLKKVKKHISSKIILQSNISPKH